MTHVKFEQETLSFTTTGRGTTNITTEVADVVEKAQIQTGLCHLFLQHTSASLILCENYDVQVRKDLENFLVRLVPDGDPLFQHVLEGEDDMPAHIRTVLTQTSVSIPIQNAKLGLGLWQGIFLFEHRHQAYKRNIVASLWGG